LNLKGAVVAVTGASSGIGKEIASMLAIHGAKLMLGARRSDLLAAEVEEVKRLGGTAESKTVDLSAADGPRSFVRATVDRFGSIDVLVNNAGANVFGPFDEAGEELMRRVMATNLEAPMLASMEAIPIMKKQKSGAIVNISSLAAFSTPPWLAIYAVSKSGLLALSRNLRFELRPFGIRVIGVYPGDVDTTFAQSVSLTKSAAPLRSVLGRSRRLFVTKQQVAKLVVGALEGGTNADLFVGSRARMAKPVIVHSPGLVDRALRGEYARLLHRSARDSEGAANPRDS
jgi:short-subunit dehydrogenase